ncbi:NAD(P)H-dependent flavin oxidoreductase YrpB (nitropropane dioxygenase family) [Paraburkholderia sp. GAS348]
MGVGISAHRLAGSVAREGALGTIASTDLRHHHRDLIELLLTGATRPAAAGRWAFSLG